MPQAQDAFRSEEDHWFATEKKFYRVVRSQPPGARSRSRMSTGPSWSTTSSSRRRTGGASGVARFRYPDRSGQSRVFDWALDGQQGKSVALPESDLTVTLSEATEFPTSTGRLDRDPGRRPDSDRRVQDPVGQGRAGHPHGAGQPADGPQRDSAAGRVRQSPAAAAGGDPLHGHPHARSQDQRPLRPDRGPGRARRVALLPRLRPGQGRARASSAPPGRSTKGKPIVAFGGNANMPMTITFRGRRVPAGGDREADLRADRAAQGEDGRWHRGLPGRDDRRRARPRRSGSAAR